MKIPIRGRKRYMFLFNDILVETKTIKNVLSTSLKVCRANYPSSSANSSLVIAGAPENESPNYKPDGALHKRWEIQVQRNTPTESKNLRLILKKLQLNSIIARTLRLRACQTIQSLELTTYLSCSMPKVSLVAHTDRKWWNTELWKQRRSDPFLCR